jgi:anti-sigma-K factor RskA
MSISDETLGAYVDGELDAAQRAEVEASMAQNPEIAQRLERLRATQNKLLAAFSAVTQEPVPERLLNVLEPKASAPVANLAEARERARRPKLGWTWTEMSALAASVLVGVILGYFLLRSPGSGFSNLQQGQLLVRGDLAQALSNQLASEQPRESPVRIGLTFRDKGGDYCRSFALRGSRDMAGLACRESGGWRVATLAQTQLTSSGAEPAGSALPPEVLKAIEERIAGEPLDAAAESAARRSSWGSR